MVATGVVLVIANIAGLGGGSSSPSTAASWVKLVLGALLILLGARQWHGRPKGDEPAPLPKWMAAIDNVTR